MPPLALLTPLMLLLVALVPTATALIVDTPGGWNIVVVTANDSVLLTRALTNESNYATDVDVPQRVCVYEIHSLSQQVVSGDNYRYDVRACPVSSTLSAGICAVKILTTNASCGEYTIELYEQSWTNTLQVTSIELASTDVSADANKTSSTQSSGATNSTTSSNSSSVVTPAPSPSATKSAAANALSSYSFVLALVSVMSLAASDW